MRPPAAIQRGRLYESKELRVHWSRRRFGGCPFGADGVLKSRACAEDDPEHQREGAGLRLVRDTEAGRYLLTDAILSGDDTPSAVGTAGKRGSGKDLSFENSPSYDLIGGDLAAHVGHQVEVSGITSDAKLNDSDTRSVATGSSQREKATLTVRSVKMIAAMCPLRLSDIPARVIEAR